MIYTVTANPAVDLTVSVRKLTCGEINRSYAEAFSPAGKGINVSLMLNNLGEKSISLGFVGGFTGAYLESELSKRGVSTELTHISSGITRVNVKLRDGKIGETDINAKGPFVSADEKNQLVQRLSKVSEGDIIIMSGSSANGADTLYRDIMRKYSATGAKFIVDTHGKQLSELIELGPFLIKPNICELSDEVGTTLETLCDIADGCRLLCRKGAQNVLCSLGKDGALLVTKAGNVLYCAAPEIKLADSVGAGDCMLAGFVYALNNGWDFEYALKFSVACGSARAKAGDFPQRSEVLKLLSGLETEKMY